MAGTLRAVADQCRGDAVPRHPTPVRTLAHYGNALLFAIFGTSLRTLVSFNLLLIAALTFGIYTIFRRACDRSPHPLRHGFPRCVRLFPNLRTGKLELRVSLLPRGHLWHRPLFRADSSSRKIPRAQNWFLAGVAGFLLGVVFLTKVEVFFAALLTTVVVVSLPAMLTRSLRDFGHGKYPLPSPASQSPTAFRRLLLLPDYGRGGKWTWWPRPSRRSGMRQSSYTLSFLGTPEWMRRQPIS